MRFVTFKELKTIYGIPYSRTHLYRMIRAGKFPKPERPSAYRVMWRAQDVEAWMAPFFS
jgi:predicted DNA-binding transcriptional regulator AlpA